jgi:hypothetical protein
MLLTSILAALVCTIVVAARWYHNVQVRPLPGQPPPPGPAGLIVFAALAAAAWVAVVIVACRDQIIRHVDAATARVIAHTELYGDAREQEGIFRGMAWQAGEGSAPTSPQPPPPPPLPPRSGGGHVVPFTRPPSPGDSRS